MELREFYRHVTERCPDGGMPQPKRAVHAVLMALAERLRPEQVEELSSSLPSQLRHQLDLVDGDGTFDQDEFIEDVASRLDLDDDDAETVALAVLATMRDAMEPVPTLEQVIETLPTDLAHLMHACE